MPPMVMLHEKDPKEVLLEKIGALEDIEVATNDVLLAVYLRPEKTKSGIVLTDKYRDEDATQGKVGLVVKMGPQACIDPNGNWDFIQAEEGDWLVFRASDGWAVNVHGVLCRMIKDTQIRMRIQHPDEVW